MKNTDKAILLGLALAGIVAALWFLVVSPKREEAGRLAGEIAELEASVAEQEALADQAEVAESGFARSYSSMVRLGKAAPAGSDTASLLEQLESLATESRTEFLTLTLSADAAAAPAPAPAPAAAPTDGSAAPADAAAPVAATESAVALQPLGAAVGPAGLLTMPYDLTFEGDFFALSEFLAGLDGLVHVDRRGQLVTTGPQAAKGRLLTIDGFSLSVPDEAATDTLSATVAVTSYLTPPGEGLTAGATTEGPAATVPATGTAPTSPEATAAPTATVTP